MIVGCIEIVHDYSLVIRKYSTNDRDLNIKITHFWSNVSCISNNSLFPDVRLLILFHPFQDFMCHTYFMMITLVLFVLIKTETNSLLPQVSPPPPFTGNLLSRRPPVSSVPTSPHHPGILPRPPAGPPVRRILVYYYDTSIPTCLLPRRTSTPSIPTTGRLKSSYSPLKTTTSTSSHPVSSTMPSSHATNHQSRQFDITRGGTRV